MNIFIFFLYIFVLNAQDIGIKYPSDSIFVGSQVTIEVSINNIPNNQVPIFNDINTSSEGFTFLSKKLDNNKAFYSFQFWESGIISLPSIQIDLLENNKIINEIKSNNLSFNIFSNLKSNNTLRNNKPMKIIKLNSYIQNIVYLILIIISFLYIIYIYRRKKNNSNNIYINNTYNYKTALNELDSIEIINTINNEEIKILYDKLSYIFKSFLNNRLYIKSTEMTTSEITNFFCSNNFNEDIINKWKHLSYRLDEKKFSNNHIERSHFIKDKDEYKSLIKLINKY